MILQWACAIALALTNQAVDESAPVTNSGEPFKDPFADSPAEMITPAPSVAPTVEEAPLPSGVTPPTASIPPIPSGAPAGEPAKAAAPVTSPKIIEEEPQFEEPVTPSPSVPANSEIPALSPEAAEPAKKSFKFPGVEEDKGPIAEEVVNRQIAETSTQVGSFHLDLVGGGGLNMNRRHPQVHLELRGGYRWYPHVEVGLIQYYRFMTDKLLGTLASIHGIYPLGTPGSLRWDVIYGAAMGWTLRAASSTFNEGRFTLRGELGTLFYFLPSVSIQALTAIESFAFQSGKTSANYLKDGNMPTQALFTAGVRFEF